MSEQMESAVPTGEAKPKKQRAVLGGDASGDTYIGYLAAMLFGAVLIGLLTMINIPMPGDLAPLTGQSLGVLLVGAIFGAGRGVMSVLIYAVAGFAGMPWFMNGLNGFEPLNDLIDIVVFIGFGIVAAVVGAFARRGLAANFVKALLLGVIGTAIIGVWTLLIVLVDQAPIGQALYEAILRQLPADAIRVVVFAIVIGLVAKFGPASQVEPADQEQDEAVPA